jgi:hypothetical protein
MVARSGGTGRRSRLKICRSFALCGFDSLLRDQIFFAFRRFPKFWRAKTSCRLPPVKIEPAAFDRGHAYNFECRHRLRACEPGYRLGISRGGYTTRGMEAVW